MSLATLKVFNQYAYTTAQEMLDHNIQLFNAAARGAITLRSAANQGDFSDTALYQRVSGLVRRRNAYGTGAVAEKELTMLLDTSVKVAAGTPPVRIDNHWWQWIQKSPDEAGVVLGKQLAEDTLADMLGVAVRVYAAAMGQVTALVHDGTAATLGLAGLNTGASKFGDRSSDIGTWIIHSKPVFDIYGANLTNSQNLFTFGSVAIKSDHMGRPFIVADLPDLKVTDGVGSGIDLYRTLGIVAGGILVEQNNDFLANEEIKNGDENIIRTWQAQWTYNVGLKGFAWDKSAGGASPTDAALATASNWDRRATADKDLAGVLIKSR